MGEEGAFVDVSTSFYDAPSESGEQRDRHAFAMTVYEILTGNLMYSADNYSVDEVRGFSTLDSKDKENIVNNEKKVLQEKFGKDVGEKIYNKLWEMIKLSPNQGKGRSSLSVRGFLDFVEQELPDYE